MRTLIVGYGNPYRQDDGVGFHVLKEIARRLGHLPLALDEDGLDSLGSDVDLVVLPQLLPELAAKLGDYQQAIFVDAHTAPIAEELRCVVVEPRYSPSAFTHHMKPETLMGLARAFSPVIPQAYLISIRGHNFDLGQDLSAETKRWAAVAVERIMGMLGEGDST
jgi:hydrogenase maturation protease